MDRMGHSFTYGMHTDPQAKSSGEIEGGNENHAALQGRHDTFGKEGVGPCATRKSLRRRKGLKGGNQCQPYQYGAYSPTCFVYACMMASLVPWHRVMFLET
jgi:hypothetical protein